MRLLFGLLFGLGSAGVLGVVMVGAKHFWDVLDREKERLRRELRWPEP